MVRIMMTRRYMLIFVIFIFALFTIGITNAFFQQLANFFPPLPTLNIPMLNLTDQGISITDNGRAAQLPTLISDLLPPGLGNSINFTLNKPSVKEQNGFSLSYRFTFQTLFGEHVLEDSPFITLPKLPDFNLVARFYNLTVIPKLTTPSTPTDIAINFVVDRDLTAGNWIAIRMDDYNLISKPTTPTTTNNITIPNDPADNTPSVPPSSRFNFGTMQANTSTTTTNVNDNDLPLFTATLTLSDASVHQILNVHYMSLQSNTERWALIQIPTKVKGDWWGQYEHNIILRGFQTPDLRTIPNEYQGNITYTSISNWPYCKEQFNIAYIGTNAQDPISWILSLLPTGAINSGRLGGELMILSEYFSSGFPNAKCAITSYQQPQTQQIARQYRTSTYIEMPPCLDDDSTYDLLTCCTSPSTYLPHRCCNHQENALQDSTVLDRPFWYETSRCCAEDPSSNSTSSLYYSKKRCCDEQFTTTSCCKIQDQGETWFNTKCCENDPTLPKTACCNSFIFGLSDLFLTQYEKDLRETCCEESFDTLDHASQSWCCQNSQSNCPCRSSTNWDNICCSAQSLSTAKNDDTIIGCCEKMDNTTFSSSLETCCRSVGLRQHFGQRCDDYIGQCDVDIVTQQLGQKLDTEWCCTQMFDKDVCCDPVTTLNYTLINKMTLLECCIEDFDITSYTFKNIPYDKCCINNNNNNNNSTNTNTTMSIEDQIFTTNLQSFCQDDICNSKDKNGYYNIKECCNNPNTFDAKHCCDDDDFFNNNIDKCCHFTTSNNQQQQNSTTTSSYFYHTTKCCNKFKYDTTYFNIYYQPTICGLRCDDPLKHNGIYDPECCLKPLSDGFFNPLKCCTGDSSTSLTTSTTTNHNNNGNSIIDFTLLTLEGQELCCKNYFQLTTSDTQYNQCCAQNLESIMYIGNINITTVIPNPMYNPTFCCIINPLAEQCCDAQNGLVFNSTNQIIQLLNNTINNSTTANNNNNNNNNNNVTTTTTLSILPTSFYSQPFCCNSQKAALTSTIPTLTTTFDKKHCCDITSMTFTIEDQNDLKQCCIQNWNNEWSNDPQQNKWLNGQSEKLCCNDVESFYNDPNYTQYCPDPCDPLNYNAKRCKSYCSSSILFDNTNTNTTILDKCCEINSYHYNVDKCCNIDDVKYFDNTQCCSAAYFQSSSTTTSTSSSSIILTKQQQKEREQYNPKQCCPQNAFYHPSQCPCRCSNENDDYITSITGCAKSFKFEVIDMTSYKQPSILFTEKGIENQGGNQHIKQQQQQQSQINNNNTNTNIVNTLSNTIILNNNNNNIQRGQNDEL